jgi:hypothetical protein
MKTLHLILCALVTGTVTEAQRGPQSRDIEIIRPLATNLFARPTDGLTGRTVGGRETIIVGPATNRLGSPVLPGRSTNLNTVALTNTGVRTPSSGLIGPVFPGRDTNFTAAGGTTIGPDGLVVGGGFGTNGVGATGVPMLTNALQPGFGANVGRVPETTAPGPSVPQPAGTPPLAPPTPIAPPAPGVPGSVSPGGIPGNVPNAAPSVPGSAAPAPAPGAPLAPPTGPALPPTSPGAPSAGPGGAGSGTGTR